MKTKVTAAIISLNEEARIARCLRALTWVDEIVVVDGGSTDRTVEICEDPGTPWAGKIRVLTHPWQGFRVQRTYAMEQSKNDWILVVDSDEECSPELAAHLQELLAQPGGPPLKAYKVHRQEYFLGKPIYWGIWNPSYQDRFFNRQGVKYVNDIHEYPIFPSVPGRIHEPLLHDPGFNPDQFLAKMNKYTTIEARDRVNAGKRTNPFRMVMAFPAMFLKNYFYYKAYRDGIHGFAISILEGISRAVRHVKMWQHMRQKP
jgi:glycosyltransferase involved in cell wall biosynthesis